MGRTVLEVQKFMMLHVSPGEVRELFVSAGIPQEVVLHHGYSSITSIAVRRAAGCLVVVFGYSIVQHWTGLLCCSAKRGDPRGGRFALWV